MVPEDEHSVWTPVYVLYLQKSFGAPVRGTRPGADPVCSKVPGQSGGAGVKKDSAWYFAGIVLLGVSTCLTANGFFHFFNILGILLLFMAAMVHQFYNDSEWGFAEYVKKFFILAGTCIASAGDPFKVKLRRDSAHVREQKESRRNAKAAAAGIAAAALFLIVVMPLLVMSDKIFSEFFYRFFGYLDLSYLIENVDIENIVG